MLDKRDLLEVLKHELEFVQKGGYDSSTSWRPKFVFEDSPSCLNLEVQEDRKPCSDCVPIALVPPEHRQGNFPCRHIPLNRAGQTVGEIRLDLYTGI